MPVGGYLFTGTLTINSGVTVTINSNIGGGQVVIISDNITNNGTISANSTGFAEGLGTGGTTNAQGGAAYGGDGGGGTHGGVTYGSVTAPTDLGSGGGNTGQGGKGGGSVKLQSTGTITITGSVTANGGAGGGGNVSGSGGSIWIDAGTIAGSGTVTANGGAGSGGGGGGRIAIYYTTDSSSWTKQAFGGVVGGANGGAGTIYVKAAAATNGDLVIDNNGTNGWYTTQATTASQTYDNVTVKNFGFYRIPSTFTTTVATALSGSATNRGAITVNSGGTLNVPTSSFTFNQVDVNHHGAINVSGAGNLTDLTLTSSSYLYDTATATFDSTNLTSLTVGSSGTFTERGTATISLGTLTVQSTGTVTHDTNTTAQSNKLIVSATTIDVQTGGSVNVDFKGFQAQSGTGGTTNAQGGAAYGGNGGGGTGAGVTYGSVTAPTDLGSGGGNVGQNNNGGGAVKLVASGTLTVNGTISANGNSGTGGNVSGSGGSIWLDSDTLAGSGTIRANGGAGSGGGGGGRVALYYNTDSSTTTRQVFGGVFGSSNGGAGTLFLDDKNDALANGDLVIDNNNTAPGSFGLTTQATTASQTYDNVTVKNGAKFVVPNTFTLTLASGGTLTGGGSTRPALVINSGGTLGLPATTSINTAIDITHSGVIATATSLTLTSATLISSGTFSAGLANLTLGSSGIFERSGTSTLSLSGTLTVQSGGILRHVTNTTALSHSIDISAATIDVQTGGTVDVSGRGFTNDNGTGTPNTCGGGAGHGGNGGSGSNCGATGGSPYGSVTQPATMGSGGKGNAGVGGKGGGVVKLVASGTLTVNGTINANATDGSGNNAGGGSGGSVWLDAGTLAGTGTVSVNGGLGTSTGAGGAGGRIAAYFNTDSSTLISSGTKLQAYGGAGNGSGTRGGAGTVFTDDKDDAFANGDLIVDNNNGAGTVSDTTQVVTASQTFTNIIIRNGAKYVVPNTFTLVLATGGALSGSGAVRPLLTTNSGGTFTFNSTSFALSGLDLTNNGSMSTITDLTVGSGATMTNSGLFNAGCNAITVQSGGTFAQTGTSTLTCTTVTVQSGGNLTHVANTTAESNKLNISATTIDIQTGGTVNVSGRGYSNDNGPGTPNTCGGGASHGGEGGDSFNCTPVIAATYGSVKTPTTIGSGGKGNTGTGGSGGGAVKFVVSGTLTVNGTINANGTDAVGNNAGGGAGGSVWIDANVLAGSGNITSSGGIGTSTGGGGAGGRIAIYYNSSTHSGARQLFGGAGNGSGERGGAGTLFIDDKDDAFANGDLIVDNNNGSGTHALTSQVSATALTFDNVTISNGSRYNIPNTSTMTVASGGAFTGGGAVRPSLTVASGGTFNPPAAAFAVSAIDITNSGTFGVATTLSLTNSIFTNNGSLSATVTDLTFNAGASTFVQNGTGFNDQDIVVGNSGTFVAQGALTANSLTVQNTGTFEQRKTGSVSITTVTVLSGGNLTHTANTSSKLYELNISATTVDIQSGANVDLSGKGFTNDNGTGTPSNCGGGASHGGKGGETFNCGSTIAATYGSVTQPSTLGSGGKGNTGTGGKGGGVAKFVVSGTLTVNGTINANATDGSGNNAGGGSGGSVWIDTGVLAGGSNITVSGGLGTSTGAGGGGGRIALYYNSSTWTGSPQAFGGTPNAPAWRGGAGTIFIDDKDDAFTNGDLIVDSNNLSGTQAETVQVAATNHTFDNVTVKNGARYTIPSGDTLTVVSTGTFTGGGSSRPSLTINSGGTFNPPSAFAPNVLDVTNNGTLNTVTTLTLTSSTFTHNGTFGGTVGTVTIGSGGNMVVKTTNTFAPTTVTVQSGGTFTQETTGALTIGTLTVQSGGALTHTANTTSKLYELNISATTVDLQSGASLDVSGKGFTNDQGTGTPNTCGGGAGHGGKGGDGSNCGALGGTTYGSVTQPTTMGSGGKGNAGVGGKGGGVVKLVVSGTLTVNANINANATDGSSNNAGGGSGGSIWLDAGTLAGGANLTVNGGAGTSTGAGGGGGRIAVYYATDSSTIVSSGTKLQSYGGAGNGSGTRGGAGTVFTKASTATNGDLIVDNNNGAGTTAQTLQVAATNQTYDNVTVRNGAQYVVPSTSTINAAANMTLGGTAATKLELQHTNTMTVGGTLTINSGGTLTHGANATTKTANVTVSAFSLTVNSGGAISANGLGYAGSEGPNQGTDGSTAGGGGHGASGGNASGGASGGAAGDSSTNPTDLGSGGGDDTDVGGQQGGAGGGEIRLTVTNVFTNNGTISANGANGAANEGGGGAGGTVNVTTGIWAGGTGTITATGGQGSPTGAGATGGGGGAGGRVFVGYLAKTYSGTTTATGGAKGGATSAATGGANGTPVEQQNNAPVPATASISPIEKNLNDPGFTLTVNGSNFVATSVVQWNGSSRTTTMVSTSQLTATIPGTDLQSGGGVSVTVMNPAPGGGTSNGQTFNVLGGSSPGSGPRDTEAPSVTNVLVSDLTATGATFTWSASEASTTKLNWGKTATYMNQSTGTAYVTGHKIVLTTLSPDTTYHFQACAVDPALNQGCSPDATFTTPATLDVTAPVITGFAAKDVTPTTATIVWTTDEPATSNIDFGLSATPPFDGTIFNISLSKEHSVSLQGLTPLSTYHVRVRTADASGNETTSTDLTFVTLPASEDRKPPVIAGVSASPTTVTAKILWTTDEPSDSLVEWGTTTRYGSKLSDAALTKNHVVEITGLLPSVTYHFRVTSADALKNKSVSQDATFVTLKATVPVISDVRAVPSVTSARITWMTGVPSDSLVEWGTTTRYGSKKADAKLAPEHSLLLEGLKPATAYNFRVTSADALKNKAVSGNFTFTTTKPPPPAITNVAASVSADYVVTVTWTTDVATASLVEYGPSAGTALGSRASASGRVTSHKVTIANLLPGTTWKYRVSGADQYGQNTVSGIATFTLPADTVPPPDVIGFKATAGDGKATLEWQKPSGSDWRGAYVVRKAGSEPQSRTDGTRVYNSSGTFFTSAGLRNGTTYFFKAFSFDRSGNYSAGVVVSATPAKPASCVDSDAADEAAAGSAKDDIKEVKDGCANGNAVKEAVCRDGVATAVERACDSGFACVAGACEKVERPKLEFVCGDGLCQEGETAASCPVDCVTSAKQPPPSDAFAPGSNLKPDTDVPTPPSPSSSGRVLNCGDALCVEGESADSCPADCIAAPAPSAETTAGQGGQAAEEPPAPDAVPEEQGIRGNDVRFFSSAGPGLAYSGDNAIHALPKMPIRVYVPDSATTKPVLGGYVLLGGEKYPLRETHSWEVNVPAPSAVGEFPLTLVMDFQDGSSDSFLAKVTVEPYGSVYETKGSQKIPVQGATVLLLRKIAGAWVVAETVGNPVTTGADGSFAFVPGPGTYKLRVEKAGYGYRETLPFDADGVVRADVELVAVPPPIKEEIAKALETGTVAEKTSKVAQAVTKAAAAQAKIAVVEVRDAADNPIVEEKTEQVAVPAAAAVAAANVATAATATATAAPYALYLWSFLAHPTLLIARRKRKKWGVVYNSLTKLPVDLAIVRLLDAKTGRIIRSAVTDKDGRYFFIVTPGAYRLSVIKTGHAFPTNYLKGVKTDVELADLYHGEDLTVAEESSITANVPVDPMGQEKTPRRVVMEDLARRVQSSIGVATIVAMGVAALIVQTAIIWAVLAANVVMYLAMRRLAVTKKPKSWGTVLDEQTGKPLQSAVARIFDSKYNKLLETQVTDGRGRYAFLVGASTYYVTFEKPGYEKRQRGPVDMAQGERTKLMEERVVALDVKLAHKAGGSVPKTPPAAPPAPPEPPAPPQTPKPEPPKPPAPPQTPPTSPPVSATPKLTYAEQMMNRLGMTVEKKGEVEQEPDVPRAEPPSSPAMPPATPSEPGPVVPTPYQGVDQNKPTEPTKTP